MYPLYRSIMFLSLTYSLVSAAPLSLTSDQNACLAKGKRFERGGWVYLHIEGEPRERGFQHGYLLAKEINDGLIATRAGWEYESAMEWSWLVHHAAAMFVPKIDPENLAELEGIS